MTRIDMSEYMERYAVSRLIGAPPGYVGYEEGGQLTEAVRRRPYQVVLLDEIEKAHPDVFNVLLQVLDDGRLTDGQGHTVSFKDTVLIMTSNVGSQLLGAERRRGRARKGQAEQAVLDALRATFRPEFLNRIDEIIVFHRLDESALSAIVDLLVADLERRLADHDLRLVLTPAAKALIGREGTDPQYGARPLKRAIQRLLENPLARALLEGRFKPGTHDHRGRRPRRRHDRVHRLGGRDDGQPRRASGAIRAPAASRSARGSAPASWTCPPPSRVRTARSGSTRSEGVAPRPGTDATEATRATERALGRLASRASWPRSATRSWPAPSGASPSPASWSERSPSPAWATTPRASCVPREAATS